MSSNTNYAKAVGYHSEAAAFIFAILYLPFSGWFIRQSFVRPTYVHFTLVLFTTIRVAAFILRGILVSVESVGENLSALIADEILFGVGFFSLLYASYTLVLDLETMQNRPESTNPIIRLTKNRRAFRLTLTLAVALGIAASSSVSNTGVVSSTGKTLRKVSTIIFLILTVLQLFQTFLLAQMEIAASGQEKRHNESFGARHAMSILLIGAALLLVREAFSTATMTNIAKQNNEHFWYPLVAVPEILIVALLSTPGLVPRRDEVKPRYPQDLSAQTLQA